MEEEIGVVGQGNGEVGGASIASIASDAGDGSHQFMMD